MIACGSTPPENLGLRGDRLAPCPDNPNCVSSFAPSDDETHWIQPFTYRGARASAQDNLLALLEDEVTGEGVTIVENREGYLRAEFRTPFWKFTDDVEFYFPADKKVIHIRSASRLGKSDLGANRKRIEKLRTIFTGNK